MALWLWLILGLVALIAIVLIYYFNKFSVLENRIDNSSSQIDVQLKRRADLIPNLIETVKGYAKHEKGIIEAVANARKALVGAKDLDSKVKANDKLESALKTVFALAENYPNLKTNENFLELQRELAATEDKIAYSRQYYNDSVLSYANLFKTFPGNFFAKIYGKTEKQYLKITAAEREAVKVNF